MSTLRAAQRTQIRINAALDMIDQGHDELSIRFCVAYAIGYIDALCEEQRISVDGAQLYREDAYARRQVRLAALGAPAVNEAPDDLWPIERTRSMIHLVIAEIGKETRLPLRAFTELEATRAFLAKVKAHHDQRPSNLDNPNWEFQYLRWSAQHPARDCWGADRFYIHEPVPLDDE